jgi:hypothetical protein
MDFQTKVHIGEQGQPILHTDSVMFTGSCFAANMGEKFIRYRFNALVNPFGVVYNPLSVANALKLLVENSPIPDDAFVEHDGLWHSLYHHGSFSDASLEACRANIEKERSVATQFIQSCNYLFITFGTAWVYEYVATGLLVSNCHKLPAGRFNRFRLNVDEIVTRYKKLIAELLLLNPALKIVFTVSPIRHWKDGAHGNQLSKSVLLLAVDELCTLYSCVSYFPSYEIVMDELRDYRFYSPDMLHLTDQTIEYIWKRFSEVSFERATIGVLKKIEEVLLAVEHRPFNAGQTAYQQFIRNTLKKINELELLYPYLDFYDEKKILNERIIS